MQIEHLEYLIDLSQTKSFSKTAKKYYTTHQSISYGINHLEKAFGVKILNRTNHGISFTEAGNIVLEFAKSVLNTKADYEQKILPYKESITLSLSGHFDILLAPRFANKSFWEFINNFKELYPNFSFSIMSQAIHTNIGPLEAVRLGKDMALLSINSGVVDLKGLHAFAENNHIGIQILARQALGYVISNTSPYISLLTETDPEKLRSYPYISYNNSLPLTVIQKLKKFSCIDNSDMLKTFISSGDYIGIITLSEYYWLFKNNQSVAFVPITQSKKNTFYLVAYRHELATNPLFKKFIQAVKHSCIYNQS